MKIDNICITLTREVKEPTRGTPQSAGLDFYVPNDFNVTTLNINDSVKIPLGVKVRIPPNSTLIMYNKSGVATKLGLVCGACVIDADYQGEVHAHLIKISGGPITISPGDKIVQGVLIPILYPMVKIYDNEYNMYNGIKSERGNGGFASTGNK